MQDTHFHDVLFAEVSKWRETPRASTSQAQRSTEREMRLTGCRSQALPLARLEDDWKLLGSLLDDCLLREIGSEMFAKVVPPCPVTSCRPVVSASAATAQAICAFRGPGFASLMPAAFLSQVEKIRSLAHCASDLALNHDVVSVES